MPNRGVQPRKCKGTSKRFFDSLGLLSLALLRGERLEEFCCIRLRAQGLFMRRADGLVGARAADETRIGRKFPGSNVSGGFLHDLLSLVELFRIAGAHLDLIVLQIVKDQADGVPFENLFRRKRVETELQIFLRVSILFWLACFVV